MILAQFFLISGWILIKFLGEHLPVFELVFFRGFFGFLPILLLLIRGKKSFPPKVNNRRDMFLRCLFGSASMILYFFALTKLSIGDTSTLLNTSPIFIALFAPFMLKEKFSPRQFWVILSSFCFVLLVLRPGTGIFADGAVFALLAGALAGFAMIEVRKLKDSDGPIVITMYFTFSILLISIVPMAIGFVIPHKMDWILFVVLGLTVTSFQLLMTKAYALAKATTIAPFAYTAVVLSYLADILIFGKEPSLMSIIGAIGIVCCGVIVMLTAKKDVVIQTSV